MSDVFIIGLFFFVNSSIDSNEREDKHRRICNTLSMTVGVIKLGNFKNMVTLFMQRVKEKNAYLVF